MGTSNRRIIVVVLILLTIVLGIAAVLIASNLAQQEQAPEDSSAAPLGGACSTNTDCDSGLRCVQSTCIRIAVCGQNGCEPGETAANCATDCATGTASGGTRNCGQACTQDSQCRTGTGGASTICHPTRRVCVNPNCPNDTINGSLCACRNTSGVCGDPCGSNELPLCGGGSECGYIGALNACTETNGVSPTSPQWRQFCLPRLPFNGYTVLRCTNGVAALNLRTPAGGNVTSRAQVIQACSQIVAPPPPVIADPICGDGACTNAETPANCPADCALPDTALVSDETDPILFGVMLILIGLIVYKFNLFERTYNLLNTVNVSVSVDNFRKKYEDRTLEIYERKERERIEKVKKKKTTKRKPFEERVIRNIEDRE